MAPLAEALAAAARQVARVAAGRNLSLELQAAPMETAGASRAAVMDLCYGTLRRYGRSQSIVAALSRRGAANDPAIEALLWCALYALDSGRYAEYTVVDQAAAACAELQRFRAKPFVNAVLRQYLRSRAAIEARIAANPAARYCHPDWWIARLRKAYPDAWESILAAGNSHPPMCLRVNLKRDTRDGYAAKLQAQGIATRAVGSAALLLDKPLPSGRLPGFLEGAVSVQDAGAQCAAALLDLRDGQRVLDACAAPGGKSAHLLESACIDLTALDIDPERCVQVTHNLVRLGHKARVQTGDCSAPESWWDGRPFERVLADVPCSASGIVRRHPDIKWLRRADDLAGFAERQSRILDALWRVLGPGGKLLYVTCSVFPEENEAVVDAFIARTVGARRSAPPAGASRQLLPDSEHDGFFFALLEKSA